MALAFLLGRKAAAEGPHDSGEDGRVTYAPATERQELLQRKVRVVQALSMDTLHL